MTLADQAQIAKTTYIIQGEYGISRDPGEAFSTVLGSCVSACFYDRRANVGGMNHFLLSTGPADNSDCLKYGVHAMELLINEMVKNGAMKADIEGKLFGGAHMLEGHGDIGDVNARFALEFCAKENIPLTGQSLGGNQARRIRFWPATGKTQQRLINGSVSLLAQEVTQRKATRRERSSGAVEFF